MKKKKVLFYKLLSLDHYPLNTCLRQLDVGCAHQMPLYLGDF